MLTSAMLTPNLKPEAIAAYSRPPYELSFKENGCIIFIAALSPYQLIVTSKHSLGANESKAVSHAQKGEEWLDRHLRSVDKTKQDLAQQLWNHNETAVAELCDDSFEEHVLAYPPERTGLHLHGLNANTADFQTRSMKEVESFARQWGFLPTRFLEMNSIEDVNTFTRTVAETGTWQGTAIEGFVVRTRMPGVQDQFDEGSRKTLVAPPYAKGQTWFYKVKFDEPYLMYRDWRELTRRMLSDKEAYERDPRADQTKRPDPPAVAKKRPETQLFVQWCYEQMYGSADGALLARPELFEGLSQNYGIIKLRNMFIEYMSTEQGKEEMKKWQKSTTAQTYSEKPDIPFTKTLIVPIAIPGCGKTALGVALTHLFKGIGHTQSDDVQTKRTGPTFLRNITNALDEHDVVFADRNNHLYKHRDEVVKCARDWEAAVFSSKTSNGKQGKKKKNAAPINGAETSTIQHRVRLIAFIWPLDDLPLNMVHHLCCDRVVERGANHQSLRFEEGNEHEAVLWHFLQTRQEFNSNPESISEQGNGGDQAFDTVIKLDVRSTLEEMIQSSVKQLASLLNLPIPSQERISQAIKQARLYRVNVKKESKGITSAPTRYYGLSVEVDLPKALQPLIQDHADAKCALDKLVSSNRVITRPHVTLVHNSDLKSASEIDTETSDEVTESQVAAQKKWDFYSKLHQDAKAASPFTMQVDCLAWNDRAMSLGVSHIFNEQYANIDELQGKEWRPHITVGTFHEDIRPYEGNSVLRLADTGSLEVSCIRFSKPLNVVGRLRGLA
jgi:tRNA ligase